MEGLDDVKCGDTNGDSRAGHSGGRSASSLRMCFAGRGGILASASLRASCSHQEPRPWLGAEGLKRLGGVIPGIRVYPVTHLEESGEGGA